MTKLRARRQHVDYTDLLSPAAKAPASAVGRKKAGGRKPEAADAGDAEDAEEEDMTKHAKGKPAKPRKKVAARDTTVVSTNANEDEADVPPRKTAKNKKKKKKSAYDDDDEEAVARQQDDEPQRKRRQDKHRTKAASRSGSDADELTTLRKKYEALKKFRETETERILKDAKALALEEKKTYEKLIAKLKHEVSRLSSRADDASARHSKQIDKLQAEHQQRLGVTREGTRRCSNEKRASAAPAAATGRVQTRPVNSVQWPCAVRERNCSGACNRHYRAGAGKEASGYLSPCNQCGHPINRVTGG
ncbi:hypothetical protein PINS_up015720 [Pythium insidiosum]|nr:hypothetical protein PINS_up015720 [Pythium insidiosum]